jgi:manganese oxidase
MIRFSRCPDLTGCRRARVLLATSAVVSLISTLPLSAQRPLARANDHRISAGKLVNGERQVALEVMLAEWHPRGAKGPVRTAVAFAESGKAPSMPGPMIRLEAGTPVRVSVRNTLAQPVRVFGLGERSSAHGANGPVPGFADSAALAIPPGETREVRFTASAATTSFYSASLTGAPLDGIETNLLEGVFIVDPRGEAAPRNERVMLISTGSLDEDSPTFKFFINGTSWPETERLTYTMGDTVRWRVINTAPLVHPMHLHGFYFTVDARGDGIADTVYARGQRPHVVTDRMNGVSSLRLHWVATEPGNWLFHCHLIRHMGEPQLYAVDRAAKRSTSTASKRSAPSTAHSHAEHDMAGLVMGITVRPRPGVARTPEPKPTRRIDLWTSTRQGAFAEGPGLAFVVQERAVPAADSMPLPSSTLELHQGEPTRIVVHNRLSFPLSLHWHGLELASRYDGVGGWSGDPATPRPPIAPGDSMAVLITPPRAGTFMYHVHGEPEHELSQGLSGGFLVLPRGVARDPTRDRLFLLSSRGAVVDAPPAINGLMQPPPERFAPGEPVRLRFAHISADELKTIRLLRDGQVVSWRLLAKDGADLPAAQRLSAPASLTLGVGETHDVEWTPPAPGLYLLEVRTTYYPQRGGAQIQRVPFAVGVVSEAAMANAVLGTDLPVVTLDAAAQQQYVALYTGATARFDERTPHQRLRIMIDRDQQLYVDRARATDTVATAQYLIPIDNDNFVYGALDAGVIADAKPAQRLHFVREGAMITSVEVIDSGMVTARLTRTVDPVLSDSAQTRLLGVWSPPDKSFTVRIDRDTSGLVMTVPGGQHVALKVDAVGRLIAPQYLLGFSLEFSLGDTVGGGADGTTGITVALRFPAAPPIPLQRQP